MINLKQRELRKKEKNRYLSIEEPSDICYDRSEDYSKDKYRPGREVIYVILYDKSNFDKDYFISQVLSAFNDMIPDSALVWETGAKVA